MSTPGRKPFFIPIGGKMAAMTMVMLLAASIPIAMQTSELVKKNTGRREEDSNSSHAESRAAVLNGLLKSYIGNVKIIGTLRIQEAAQKTADSELAASNLILRQDDTIVTLEVFTKGAAGKLQSMGRYVDDRYLKGYKKDKDQKDAKAEIEDLWRVKPFPVEGVFSGAPVLRNRSIPGRAPLITLGVPVALDNLGRVSHIAVADLPLSLFQRSFTKSERTVFLVDKDGNVLAHSDNEALVAKGENLMTLPVVKQALASKVAKGQLKYINPRLKNETFIAAYARSDLGLVVVSQAPESVILEPAIQVQTRVYYIAGIAISIAFLVVYLFSFTLTRPIELLVQFAGEVARGNFSILAGPHVRSRDEVEVLANAFDGMTAGLRERDKVKGLMNKFHGSAVTDNLMESNEVGLSGVKKNVVVFFSDIRGFTAFSENKSPEQVVGMLNEYFQAMVKVIYAHSGIVDKFIGDAIMAIWGSPKTTGDDPYHAVMACLEMRIALDELNKVRVQRGDVPIKIGMGLHYGEAISGTIGSEDRMEFTVIGDTVNMASRIESSTKAFGTDFLLSEEIVNVVKARFIFEEAGSAEVKGKSDPLKFFKCRGYVNEKNQPVLIKTPWSDYEAEKAEKVKVS